MDNHWIDKADEETIDPNIIRIRITVPILKPIYLEFTVSPDGLIEEVKSNG